MALAVALLPAILLDKLLAFRVGSEMNSFFRSPSVSPWLQL